MVVSTTRSTPTSDKEKTKIPRIMKLKIVKKTSSTGDGGVKAEMVGSKKKGKALGTGPSKKRKLEFDTVKEDKGVVIVEPSLIVKNWDYWLLDEQRYSCRVTMGTKFKVIEDIKKSLSARQLELLGETFLGHFSGIKTNPQSATIASFHFDA
ncbi:uncharacterized protein LOC126672983 [Mercurialis annua]|uniref:uncharacterized protein LOC126672983 n=1 Tax=Mercurialis annua TaxID=3986 RepID=UPI002160D5C6|nr:uncharacterized protein LOC126672983 [Mercurialis annua]